MKVRRDHRDTLRAMGVMSGHPYPPNDPSAAWRSTPPISAPPTQEEIKAERAYGTPGPQAGDAVPRITRKDFIGGQTLAGALARASAAKPSPEPEDRLTNNEADVLYASKMLAQNSSIAALGFDESRFTLTRAEKGRSLNYRGGYLPSADWKWTQAGIVSTPVHESIHRGIKLLADAGSVEAKELSHYDNEIVTRAFMLRHFGDIEKQTGSHPADIETAAHNRANNPRFVELLQVLDKQAAHEIARKNLEKYPDTGYGRALKAGRGWASDEG